MTHGAMAPRHPTAAPGRLFCAKSCSTQRRMAFICYQYQSVMGQFERLSASIARLQFDAILENECLL
jgi:hypothetical protein